MYSEEEKRKIAAIHDHVLDAPFNTWTYDGVLYHDIGLLQCWVRGYTIPTAPMLGEPPAFALVFLKWLEDHGCKLRENFVGPPYIEFPDAATAELFKTEWHDRARDRYPYYEQEKCNQYMEDFSRERFG